MPIHRPPDASDRWCLTPDADLSWHRWGDEVLVHHAASNDTHRLSAWAAALLLELVGRPRLDRDALAAACELDPSDVDEAMQALAELELVMRC